MPRQIYTVYATQVVVSDNHPEGVYSAVTDFPKVFDSRNYGANENNPNGSDELALIVAQAEFADRVKQLSLSTNRVMWTVMLIRSDGWQIAKHTYGVFPDVTPVSEPEEPEEPEVIE